MYNVATWNWKCNLFLKKKKHVWHCACKQKCHHNRVKSLPVSFTGQNLLQLKSNMFEWTTSLKQVFLWRCLTFSTVFVLLAKMRIVRDSPLSINIFLVGLLDYIEGKITMTRITGLDSYIYHLCWITRYVCCCPHCCARWPIDFAWWYWMITRHLVQPLNLERDHLLKHQTRMSTS